jgi:cystathionine beta-lyase/cystathionine gamma-synthase
VAAAFEHNTKVCALKQASEASARCSCIHFSASGHLLAYQAFAWVPPSQVLFTETVSNPTLVVADLPQLADIAHSKVSMELY